MNNVLISFIIHLFLASYLNSKILKLDNFNINKTANFFLLISTMIFWGLSWPVAKILVTSTPPMLVGSLRFLTASILFIFVTIIIRDKFDFKRIRQNLHKFFLLGLFGIWGYGVLFLVGLQFTTSAQGAIIAGVNPAMVTIFSILLNNERIKHTWQYSGLVISFIGVIFVIGIGSILNYNPDYLIGNLLILTAMVCWGLYSSLGSKFMKEFNSFESTSFAVYFGMILFFISAFLTGDIYQINFVSTDVLLGIIYLGAFVTFLGFFFFFTAIKNIGPTESGIFINLVPIFGTIFSYLLLDELIHWTFLIGLILIVCGILVINYDPQ